jgi:hypothetical protein
MSTFPEYSEEITTIDKYWHFDLLCQDLACHKIPERPLSPVETLLLTEFLLGYTPNEIAKKSNRADAANIRVDRATYLYPLLKSLIYPFTQESLRPNSPHTLILLERMGYRKALMPSPKTFDINTRFHQFADDR